VLQVEPHVDGIFLLLNGDDVFSESVAPTVEGVAEEDAALAVEEVLPAFTATTGVIQTDETGRMRGSSRNRPSRRRWSRPGVTSCRRTSFMRVRCSGRRPRASTS